MCQIELEQMWRANIYRLLARLLQAPPDAALLAQISEIRFEKQRPEAPISKAWQDLSQLALRAELVSLSEQFHILFIGVTGGELLPYASWYQTGFLMEKPLAELRLDLARLGIERQVGSHEPEDHVAAVFETMTLLIQEGHREQQIFFQRHIANWAMRFLEDLQVAGKSGFYSAVAVLGKTFLMLEMDYFQVMESG